MKKKNNIMLICGIAIILLAAVIFVWIFKGDKTGEKAVVTIDGNVVFEQPLDKNCALPIQASDGYNIFVVQEGYALIQEADCPHQDCVKHDPINKVGETIVCLPHKLVVEIQ